MKKIAIILGCMLCAGLFAACNNNKKEPERKIYLTREDYLQDLNREAQTERREAAPNKESNYVFNMVPETEPNIYFFNERLQPKVPDQPDDSEYKNEKRLWQKPRRYTPDEYYGMQPQQQESSNPWE